MRIAKVLAWYRRLGRPLYATMRLHVQSIPGVDIGLDVVDLTNER